MAAALSQAKQELGGSPGLGMDRLSRRRAAVDALTRRGRSDSPPDVAVSEVRAGGSGSPSRREESDEECAWCPGSPTGRQGSDLMAAKAARQETGKLAAAGAGSVGVEAVRLAACGAGKRAQSDPDARATAVANISMLRAGDCGRSNMAAVLTQAQRELTPRGDDSAEPAPPIVPDETSWLARLGTRVLQSFSRSPSPARAAQEGSSPAAPEPEQRQASASPPVGSWLPDIVPSALSQERSPPLPDNKTPASPESSGSADRERAALAATEAAERRLEAARAQAEAWAAQQEAEIERTQAVQATAQAQKTAEAAGLAEAEAQTAREAAERELRAASRERKQAEEAAAEAMRSAQLAAEAKAEAQAAREVAARGKAEADQAAAEAARVKKSAQDELVLMRQQEAAHLELIQSQADQVKQLEDRLAQVDSPAQLLEQQVADLQQQLQSMTSKAQAYANIVKLRKTGEPESASLAPASAVPDPEPAPEAVEHPVPAPVEAPAAAAVAEMGVAAVPRAVRGTGSADVEASAARAHAMANIARMRVEAEAEAEPKTETEPVWDPVTGTLVESPIPTGRPASPALSAHTPIIRVESPVCPRCGVTFGLMQLSPRRRHLCRFCGESFCGSCCARTRLFAGVQLNCCEDCHELRSESPAPTSPAQEEDSGSGLGGVLGGVRRVVKLIR